MGKLQYVNRKISGRKLGAVVAKDLFKRLTSSTTHAAALRDPSIELDVSGKELDDEAILQITNALQTVYKANQDDIVIRLEELCFSRNMITAQTLETLASIIRVAALDIRDLDLSYNRLSIVTKREQDSLELFLSALGHCTALRRLDLSGNNLGTKTFELLAKAHARQTLVKPLRTNKHHSTADIVELKDIQKEPLDNVPSYASNRGSSATPDTDESQERQHGMSVPQIQSKLDAGSPYNGNDDVLEGDQSGLCDEIAGATALVSGSRFAGLRSIPYIVLDCTGMDDTSAMYLSFTVATHLLPHDLLPHVPPARAGAQYQQLLEYDQHQCCRGVMYRDNEDIRSDGLKVLELAELSRDKHNRDGIRQKDTLGIPEAPAPVKSGDTSKKWSPRDMCISEIPIAEQEMMAPLRRYHDLGIARSKIQAEVLKKGASVNCLWQTALQMLVVGRVVLLSIPTRPRFEHLSGPDFEPREDRTRRKSPKESSAWNKMGDRVRLPIPGDTSTNTILTVRSQRMSTNLPVELANQTKGLTSKKDMSQSAPITSKLYRTHLLFGFNEEVWGRILALAIDTNGVTTAKQQRAIIRRASDRISIHKEIADLGKQRANQIWMVLNGMDCLVYE